MRSGEKNVPVTIQRATVTRDPETNAQIRTWVTLHECWCSTTARRGMEVPSGGEVVAVSYIRFDFDFLDVDDVIETDRIVHDETGNIYAIKGILPDLNRKDVITIDGVLERRTPTPPPPPPPSDGNVTYNGVAVIYNGQGVSYQG